MICPRCYQEVDVFDYGICPEYGEDVNEEK